VVDKKQNRTFVTLIEMNKELQKVLTFWFEELTSEDWFKGGESLDSLIRDRFTGLHTEVAAGEFWRERGNVKSLLAEVIVLDQFSRNMFRGDVHSFAFDSLALTLSQQAISAGLDKDLPLEQRSFLYMPFMHSESKSIHADGLTLFESLGIEETLKFEKIHKDIIDRFGRYPHRNKVMGRKSTKEELEYLSSNHEVFFG